MTQLKSLFSFALGILGKLGFLAPLLARITVGVVFVESGWGKLHNIPKVVEYFVSLGLPAPAFQAHLVATTEFTCGLALLAGLLTRLASVPLIVTMVVALLTAKREDISGISDLFGASEFLYIVLLVWLVFSGAGKISIDHFLCKKCPGNPA